MATNQQRSGLVGAALFGLSGGVPAQNVAFQAQNGLLVVETESSMTLPSGWVPETELDGFTGLSYLRYEARNQFNNPGVDILTYLIEIDMPGVYRFQWHSRITAGTSTTDANDSWLRIGSSAFYGQQGTGSIVCPKGFDPAQNDCPVALDDDGDTTPNGSGGDGWFKVYRSGPGDWIWSTNTSDNDGHQIFARFDAAGPYQLEVAGRSADHAIDRWVLYHQDYDGNPLDLSLPESPVILLEPLFADGFEQPAPELKSP